MIEVTIRTNNEAALKKLLAFISSVGFQVVEERTIQEENIAPDEVSVNLKKPPIQWGENPEQLIEMFGVWKDNPITLEELRKQD
ncbi:MAG TPA: hypothetical protein PKA00_17245 [Saprospiraceae bacterium]|nr:hypothetical protein [Saprospiraceae bacterium]HMQ84666.1 hypothetical protein [Saprospiraceae bacterium]